ncbi:MAG: phytoene desaturase family protein [Candidatus Jordarchaeum sp.]|uniref:phytoene desaturase family protein n=1 Tax=Candidatus Jordarchaeum sp. TaxID=2823881 RepID=UPI0040495FE6
MSEKYDVIVIGGGLGGLSSAALLAKNGLSVLLLEKRELPGGCATGFIRGRFEFDASLHMLSGTDLERKTGNLIPYLEELGVTKKVGFTKLKNVYQCVFPDFEITLPTGRENIESVLKENFPKDSEDITNFLNRMFATFETINKFRKGDPSLTQEELSQNLLGYLGKTCAEIMYPEVKNPMVRAIISQLWMFLGLPPKKVDYIIFAVAMSHLFHYGGAQPKEKSHGFAAAFVELITEYGGEVRFGCGAKKILTEGDKVTGVLTDDDEEVKSDFIISNANPLTMSLDLIGGDKIPSSYFDKLRSNEVGMSLIGVYMGLEIPYRKLGIKEFEIGLNDHPDFDKAYQKAFTLEEPEHQLITTYNLAYPDFSPPGTSVITLTAPSYADPWYDLPPHKYLETKNRLAEQLITKAEKVAPELREHIEVVEVFTPLTIMRYTGNHGGTYLGFSFSTAGSPPLRLPQEGPLKGLYLAGAWSQPGGAYENCVLSGKAAAELILAKKDEGR